MPEQTNNSAPESQPMAASPMAAPSPAPVSVAPVSASATNAFNTPEEQKQAGLLLWILAPFYSLVVRNSNSDFVNAHAKAAFYYGVASIGLLVVKFIIDWVFGFIASIMFRSPLSYSWYYSLLGCYDFLSWLFVGGFLVVPRIIGAVQANNMQKWEMPQLEKFISKYIKF